MRPYAQHPVLRARQLAADAGFVAWILLWVLVARAVHRAVLVLKDIDGQKYEAIAEILQVPIGTVRSRLHRARLELRELLEKEE